MGKDHMKRITTPKTWPVARKEIEFVTRPNPGGRTIDETISLDTVMKELLGLTSTTRNVKNIINNQKVLVNGKEVEEEKHPVGLLQVLSIPKTEENYRLVLNKKKLSAIPIPKKEKNLELVKVRDKTTLKGGRTQLNTTSGRNIVVKKDTYKTGDTVVFDFKKGSIKKNLPFKKGMTALVLHGKHGGKIGKIKKIKEELVEIKSEKTVFESEKTNVFVVGKKKPMIKLRES